MKRNDTIAGAVFMALGATAFFHTTKFDQTLITDNYLGATFFPRIVALVMIAISALVVAGGLRGNEETAGKASRKGLIRTFAGIAAIASYALVIEPLGFIISTMLFNLIILALFGVRKPLTLMVLPPSVSLIIYWVFYKLLMVPLPEGIFFL